MKEYTMLADGCSPSHADSLSQSLRYAHGYAVELYAVIADGSPDPDRAAHLVQAIRNMLCAAEDELSPLDDAQQAMDAVSAIRELSDSDLFKAITNAPTYGNP
ncbi:hypothetical protein ACIRLA_21225 [Streptomyces sp. NPDC102364]|uniref:hypothetical protein n=1 Tax=Streptomyces sp. NPDC102364 TaxID=3366161 RepID=UPI003806E144